MALYNDAWFIHGVSEAVKQIAQQMTTKVMGAVKVKEGVKGKTYPFNVLGNAEMAAVTTRDGDTTYINPDQTKRRAIMTDYAAAILIDEFDDVRTLTNPQSEFTRALVAARNRKLDDLVLAPFGAALTGGAMGLATVVSESGESTSTSALSAFDAGSHVIANGGTGLTMAKIRDAKMLMDQNDVDEQDRYFFASPEGIEQLMRDPQVTSADFNSIKALVGGGMPMDQTFYGFKWRTSTRLPYSSGTTIRACLALQKDCVGLAVGEVTALKVSEAAHKWNNIQVVAKLTGGAVRIDDRGVVEVDIDETV